MGFGGAIILQDHVAATFGAGLGYACVVDIGDQKTSISCVEDGISHPESRIHINYGGSDITQVFYYLNRKVGFPYKSCKPEVNNFDAELLHKLKEDNCHLDLDKCGMVQKEFKVKNPGQPQEKYSIYFGDDCFIAPCALFYPDLFQVTEGKKSFRLMGKNSGDPEDPHDNIYLSETSRKYTKAGTTADGVDGNADSQQVDDDLEIVGDVDDSSNEQSNDILSLDQAILKSIESCTAEDVKRKMYSCILLVGGSSKFKGMDKYLLGEMALQIPFHFRSDPMEVISDAKDMSSSTTTWKGAAILACLESAQELWMKPQDWAKFGQKLLREKAPFPWT